MTPGDHGGHLPHGRRVVRGTALVATPILLRTLRQRTQMLCYWRFPQLKSAEYQVTIAARHIEFQERALPARLLEHHEVVLAMLDIVVRVMVAV